MVRETRHLWVGNLPDDIREEKLVEHFARYGRVESAKLTGKRDTDGSQSAFVDFVDINSATKAHDASVITIGERDLQIEYNNPDSPTEIHPGESSREYELPGRIPRYENRRGGTVEDRYDTAGPNYEFDRSYGQHYGRENSQYRDESSSSPAYRERQRERTRANFYSHSRSSDQYENDPDYLKDSYGESFGDASLRKSRLKPFKTLPGQSKSPSARSGSGSGRKSKSNSRSRSRSRSKSTDSHSSDTGSEGWSRSRSRDRESDRESRNTETTQSSLGGSSKFSGLCVRNLPARSSDSSIKDGLFHEFKKYGQVTAVTVQGVGEDRKGIVFFKRAEDMEKAMEASRGNSFFGCEMALSVWDGADLGVDDSEVKYFEKELDEFHPRATRTLFVGNLDRSVTREDLNEAFHKFGEIVHIEIKKPAGAQPFAFLQFSDIDSVVRARKKLDGEYVGKNKVKLGFGKSMATNCVWLDNLSQKVTEKYLMQFCGLRFGEVTRVVHDRRTNMALVFFINIDDSQKAVQDLKIGSIMGRRPKVDFASRECQNHFYDRMEQTGQAAYYNHSGETSPSCPTYSERNFKKSSGDYRGNYNSTTPFEPRRASRAQSSGGGFTKYSSDRYAYPSREDGYHDRPYSKEYSSIRSSSYDGDDYQQELLDYGYHQMERTKEQYNRDRSRSSSPSCRERSADGRQKSLSVEPADDAVSPDGSVEEDPVSRSPSPKRKWKGNSLMVQNSKEGSSTPMPRSPLSEEGLPEEPSSWKNRNGNSGSERGSSLDQSDLLRKTKSKLSLDIPRDEDLMDRKKKVTPKHPVDKSSSPYLERTKGDSSLHGDSHLDRTRDPLEGDKDSWVDKFKEKKSPRSDFLLDKPALKRGLDVGETVSSLQHDLESGKRWKDEETNADSVNDAASVGDLQKKLEARKQRFSDNSPVDIQKLRKERNFPPASGKVPKLGKGSIRDSEYIPKGDSFLGDSRTVEDSHMSLKEGVPPDPSDNSNGGPPCKHNDRIDSFWWMPGQKLYSDDEKGEKSSDAAAEGTLQPQQPSSSETMGDGGTTQAALIKPKKSLPDNSNLSQDRTRKRHKGRIPHILNDMDEGIASSSDQETPGSEEELGLKPLNSHSAHSNALQGSQGSDNLHASVVKSSTVDTFEKPPQLDSKLTYRKQVVKQQARQRHPSVGEGQQGLEVKPKGIDEKGRPHTSKRKEQVGTVIQEMEWKMIPLDPISFPPSGRKEQIDAIFFGSGSDGNHPTESGLEGTKLGLETDSMAAGSLLSGLNNIVGNQYCNPLSLNTVESENIRNDSDQLPLLSPKPGATKIGNTASPPTSAPPHLSPAVTPLKTKEDIQADLAKANATKLIVETLHPKPNSVIVDSRNCQKTTFPDRDVKEKAVLSSSTLSSLNEKSSYLRPGEEKVNSWLRQIPSPTLPVPLESTGETREQRSFLLLGSNNGSPSLSVTPSTPSTPSTPNDGRLGEVLSTKTRVERLSMCRIVKKNRNSVDVDSRNDKKAANDDLIKYFQDRMQQNSIFSLDEARLNSDQLKLRVGVTPSVSTSGSLLSKSKSEDVGPAESVKLNRSNSDPRMMAGSKLLSLPKSVDSTAAGIQQVTPVTSQSLGSSLEKDQDATTDDPSSVKPDVAKEDPDSRSSVDVGLKRTTPAEVTKDNLTSVTSLPVVKELPKLKSILKKRTDSVDDIEDMDDVCSKGSEQGIKRKRSPSPVSGKAKKIHTASGDTSEKKMEDSTLPKFQHPTNMLLLTPNERTKKLVVKPRSKPKIEKNAVLPAGTTKAVEKSPAVKKEVSAGKKEVSKGIGEMVKSKSIMREKANLKSTGKKIERKEERKISAEKKTDDKKTGEKKAEEKKHLEKKNVVERKDEKKSSEKQEVRKGEEKLSERKVDDGKDWKKEEKKLEKKDEKKPVAERKVEKRSDDKKQSEKKGEEKKSVKKSDEKKVVKDGKAEDKRGSERKVLEKKSIEKKGEEKRVGERKVEEKKIEKRGDEKKGIEKKGDEKKVTEKKIEEKKVDKKEDRKMEERKATEKKTSDKKVDKKVEDRKPEKKMEEKKPPEKKGDKKGAVPVVAEKRKPEKVGEKLKDTKSSEKSLPKKSEEKVSEAKPVEREKIDKSKSKSSKKLQKADSAETKMKKPAVKETLKVRSKSEDKPKGKSPQVSPEKLSTPAKKMSRKAPGSSVTPVANDGTGFGPGGFGGGVRALMDSYAESDSSESEDDEFQIFHQAASSGISKTQKAPAVKKNVIFSSSDESDSETTERRNPNPVLQKLFDRESLSDSDFDEKPSSTLVMSSEAEESPSRKQSPVKGKGKQVSEKSGRDKIEKEKPAETKKSKVEKEPKEVEKAVKRIEVIEPSEVKRGQDTKKSSTSKKAEGKAESRTKDKSGRSRGKKEPKESKASKVEETEEVTEAPVIKTKMKKRETDMEKMHSRGKKVEVFEDSLSESFDEPIREQEEEVQNNIPVEPEVKVQKGTPSKKSGKSRNKTKKGKNKSRHGFDKQVVSKNEPDVDTWKENIEEDVETKAEIETSTPLSEEVVKELEPEQEQEPEQEPEPEPEPEPELEPEPEPLPEVKPDDVGIENDLDNPPIQEYETEVVVEKVAKEEETPIVPVNIKGTKGKQKRKKGKHRQTKKGKKESHQPLPEESAPVIPEITVSSVSVEPVKQEEDRITEKEPELPERREDEVVLKSEPSVSELPEHDEAREMMDDCTDAEKAAAMFEETAEATAALELVEIDEQQRQRELAEEIFGEATPTAPSPSAPPTPSPTLPSPRPVSPRPLSPEIPDAAHEDEEVNSTSDVKNSEVVVSSMKEEVEEDAVNAKGEKPSLSVQQEEMEQDEVKTEKEADTEIDTKDQVCDEVKTEMELPKINSSSVADVTDQESTVKDDDEVKFKTEIPPVKSEEILNELKETSTAEEPSSVSLEAVTGEIPLQESCPANASKSSLPESSDEVKVNSTLPEINISENTGLKLEDIPDVQAPLKLGDSSQELKSEDLEGAEETASVEVTTETASEANDSLVIAPEALDMPAPFELPEKLPSTPSHKGKKKKKRKHREKKSSKKEGRKVDKEKKKKRKKSKSREGKRKRQKTSHKSGRHRSVSSSSYHGDLQLESHKNMERITEQATSASLEPVVNPSGLPIHKIENQQVFFSPDQHWHPRMDGMGNNFYRIPASMPGFPPGMSPMFNQSTAPIDNRFMKPPMVNSNLCPNDGNTSPLQTINADDMSLKIVGVNDNIKLINFGGMKVDTPGQVQVAGMLSPSSSEDKTKKRHPSGKSGIVETSSLTHSGGSNKVDGQTLDQMQHMVATGQGVMVKEEIEERDGIVMQSKCHQMTESTMQGGVVGKDAMQEGFFEGSSESENAKVNTKDFPQKGGEGVSEDRSQEGDVYDFNEEEPSLSGRADQTRSGQSQKNTSVDVYEFQESPGPSSTNASPSKMASAHRVKQKSRTRGGGGRTRSNSRGSAKDLKVKEEGQESGGVEETKKGESQVFPPKLEGEAEPSQKGAVAELVPSSDSKMVAKSEDPGSMHPQMPLSLPNTGMLAGVLPIGSISQGEKQMMYAADPHVRMMANVSAAQTTMATALQNKHGNVRMMPCHNSALAPSVSMPAVVAALNNNPANAKQNPHMDIRNSVSQVPVMNTGLRKQSGRKRTDKKMAAQYQPQFTQQPHPQQIRNIPSTQSQVEAVELHFKESLMRNQRQNMVHKPASSLSSVPMPPGQPVAVITSQPGIIPAMITPTGTSSASASREAPAITSQLIGVGTHSYGNRSPAMAEGMKSGPHTVASVPESQTSPDISVPGVTRSGMHPNLPSTLGSVPTPAPSKRQQGMINSKYECRVPTSVAATSFPDASVLRARLTQIEPKHRSNEEGKILTGEGQVPGAFLHPSGFVDKSSGHSEEKVDPMKPGDRNVPTEQRLPAAYHPDGHMVYFSPRPDGHPVIRGPGPVLPGMFPDPTTAGLQGLPIPGLVHPSMDISKGLPHHGNFGIAFGGPFPPRMFHPSLVHGDQNQPLASPRALASPRMVVPNTSSPRLSPKIKSPGLGHGDRSAQTPDKQAEHHNVVLRHPQAPGITTGIPPPGPEHPEVHNLPHRGLPHMMAQQPQLSKTERDLDKAPEDRRHHQGPPGQHGIPPHIQQLPAQNIPEHTRTTPGPHPERGSPGSHTSGTRTPGPDGRPQQVILPNSSTMKQWPPPGISPHTPMAVRGSHPASPIPSMGGEASVMLYVRYPVMWQGMLALKQEIATIQLHYICGNKVVATDALKMAYPPLRIAQRMRLEDSQLDGVARRMQVSEESVVLLALPCGSDQDEILNQTSAMRAGLISYLKDKQAAGIINVGPPGCTDPSYVIHIFPPCEFTERSLSLKAPDLLESVINVAYMMFVIATC